MYKEKSSVITIWNCECITKKFSPLGRDSKSTNILSDRVSQLGLYFKKVSLPAEYKMDSDEGARE